MGLSAWNAYRARLAELEKTLPTPEKEISTSPAQSGVEVEEVEEVKPKKKKIIK